MTLHHTGRGASGGAPVDGDKGVAAQDGPPHHTSAALELPHGWRVCVCARACVHVCARAPDSYEHRVAWMVLLCWAHTGITFLRHVDTPLKGNSRVCECKNSALGRAHGKLPQYFVELERASAGIAVNGFGAGPNSRGNYCKRTELGRDPVGGRGNSESAMNSRG